jgi:hypothetical protein
VRVGEGGAARPPESARAQGPKRFADALRSADRARGRGTKPPLSAEPRLATAFRSASGAAGLARAAAARRGTADRQDEALRSRRESFGEEARLASPRPPVAPAPDAVAVPELRALVRTLPLAIQTFGVRDGAPLALSFGRSLDVELRPAPRGVELVLRPEPRLARASKAELRAVVAALAAKGIAVSRAEVRVRTASGAGERAPCVDVAAGLR